MKLMLEDVNGKRLHIDLDILAKGYGIEFLETARVYDTDESFLARLEDDRELGGEG